MAIYLNMPRSVKHFFFAPGPYDLKPLLCASCSGDIPSAKRLHHRLSYSMLLRTVPIVNIHEIGTFLRVNFGT